MSDDKKNRLDNLFGDSEEEMEEEEKKGSSSPGAKEVSEEEFSDMPTQDLESELESYFPKKEGEDSDDLSNRQTEAIKGKKAEDFKVDPGSSKRFLDNMFDDDEGPSRPKRPEEGSQTPTLPSQYPTKPSRHGSDETQPSIGVPPSPPDKTQPSVPVPSSEEQMKEHQEAYQTWKGGDEEDLSSQLEAMDKEAGFPTQPKSTGPWGYVGISTVAVAMLAFLGYVGYVFLQPILFPDPRISLRSDFRQAIDEGKFDYAAKVAQRLKKLKESPEKIDDLKDEGAVEIIKKLAEHRKLKNFKKAASLFTTYLTSYFGHEEHLFEKERDRWSLLFDKAIKDENFVRAFTLFDILEKVWPSEDRVKAERYKLDYGYIEKLRREKNPKALLTILDKDTSKEGLLHLEKVILEKANYLRDRNPDLGIELMLRYAKDQGKLPSRYIPTLEKLLLSSWLSRGSDFLANYKLPKAFLSYRVALEMNPKSWKANEGIGKVKEKFTKSYIKKIKEPYKLIQEGLNYLTSTPPEFSLLFLEEGKSKTSDSKVLDLIETLVEFAKKIKGMSYVKAEVAKKGKKNKGRAFYIDRQEVTNGEYSRFLQWMKINNNHAFCHKDEKNFYPNKDHTPLKWKKYKKKTGYPVVGVDWYDAYAYSRWKKKRLATQKEWQRAASGSQHYQWPWGNEFNPFFTNTRLGVLLPVGSFSRDRSPNKCFDFASGVREWVTGTKKGKTIPMACGGDYTRKRAEAFRTSSHRKLDPSHRDLRTGFRCAHDKLKTN